MATRLVNTFVGVCSEIISLGLKQVGWETGLANSIVVSQGSGDGGQRPAYLNMKKKLGGVFKKV